MRIQLWSYNYEPEPQGIGPLSGVLARALQARGHDVFVVAAHPHYPDALWGTRIRPYRERRGGIAVLRLPLWIGRRTGMQRLRQELSFVAAQGLTAPLLPPADVIVAVSPSFPALAVCTAVSRLRRIPWVLWLQDIVTDGAVSTGLLPQGPLLHAAQSLERATYASAARIVAISEAFRANLEAKGVPPERVVRIYNPVTRSPRNAIDVDREHSRRILAMGNIGYSQGLDRIVDAFEVSPELARMGARLVIAGHGVQRDAVHRRVRSGRVEMRGLLAGDELDHELQHAALGLVSQRPDVAEFNLPSKVMNYMSFGVPVLASVRPESETAALVRNANAGWVTDARDPAEFASVAAQALGDWSARVRAGEAGARFAREHFASDRVASAFEALLEEVVRERRSRR